MFRSIPSAFAYVWRSSCRRPLLVEFSILIGIIAAGLLILNAMRDPTPLERYHAHFVTFHDRESDSYRKLAGEWSRAASRAMDSPAREARWRASDWFIHLSDESRRLAEIHSRALRRSRWSLPVGPARQERRFLAEVARENARWRLQARDWPEAGQWERQRRAAFHEDVADWLDAHERHPEEMTYVTRESLREAATWHRARAEALRRPGEIDLDDPGGLHRDE